MTFRELPIGTEFNVDLNTTTNYHFIKIRPFATKKTSPYLNKGKICNCFLKYLLWHNEIMPFSFDKDEKVYIK